jgi:hypothetical protein
MARTMQEAVQTSLSTASELARLSTDRAMQLFSPRTGDAQSLGDETSRTCKPSHKPARFWPVVSRMFPASGLS